MDMLLQWTLAFLVITIQLGATRSERQIGTTTGKSLKGTIRGEGDATCSAKCGDYIGENEGNLTKLHQNSEDLIEYIRKAILVPPPNPPTNPQFSPLTTQRGYDMSHDGQSKAVATLFKEGYKGFYIECGAFNGENESNTLFHEVAHGWDGLLIEPGSSNFKNLKKLRRNAWTANICVSPTEYAQKLPFFEFSLWSRLKGLLEPGRKGKKTTVNCVPLYSILMALNRTSVDLFSLDIEGFELDVLRTIPFDKIQFKAIVVEILNIPEPKENVHELLSQHGYILYKIVHRDLIYVHESVQKEGNLTSVYAPTKLTC